MRALFAVLLAVGAATPVACTPRDSRAASDTVARSRGVVDQQAGSEAGDTDVVHSPGVATDADDTASTRYGKHETPRRLSSPSCRPEGIALCLRDTAARVYTVDCCIADQRQSDWLVFAAPHDSMQLFLEPARDAYLTMSPANAAGASTETALGVDASWLRVRFPAAGAFIFTASIESNSAAPYELRIASVVATGASHPIGATGRLTLHGPAKAHIAVAPRSMMPAADTALRRFAVEPGVYRVLLVRDTLYGACTLPCVDPTTFTLKPGQAVEIAP